jgi:hypothetical protein
MQYLMIRVRARQANLREIDKVHPNSVCFYIKSIKCHYRSPLTLNPSPIGRGTLICSLLPMGEGLGMRGLVCRLIFENWYYLWC